MHDNEMALKMKKDVKKSSYYVWFLGAQESRGLRGDEYALPAIEHLERRSRDLEPFKVTLQVSQKGLKIVQNVAPKGKPQTVKHFIPHNSITSAVVQGDIVACVLLLYNPVTQCPIHVHAYRCDSERTAEVLCTHLRALIDKPENQRKFADIERKLISKGALPQAKKVPDSSLGSEASARESESSGEDRCVANLYDNLAAELKQKLSTARGPILLPPRDYDTVHRQRGNLSGIDTRRCLNRSIVGVNARRALESSGGSSGIGSDLAPSPDHNDYHVQHDNQSTSEEDWNESTAYMMHEGFDVVPPRRAPSPLPQRREPRYQEEPAHYRQETRNKYSEEPNYERRYAPRGRSTSPLQEPIRQPSKSIERISIREAKTDSPIRKIEIPRNNGFKAQMQRNSSESSLKKLDGSTSPKDRFNVAKEKFMNLERQRMHDELEQHMQLRRNISNHSKSSLTLSETNKKRSSQKWDDDEITSERRELPRISQRSSEIKDKSYRSDQRYYDYSHDDRYDSGFSVERRRDDREKVDIENGRYYNDRYERESPPDYRQSPKYETNENRHFEPRSRIASKIDKKRIETVVETGIEPVFEDGYRHNEVKRVSRSDAFENGNSRHERNGNREGDDDWRNHKRPVSRSRLLKDANSNRHSMYEQEEIRRNFDNRRSYAEVESSSRRYPDDSFDQRYSRHDMPARYRDTERERFTELDREPAKVRHSYAEPIIRNRVGMATVRPY